MAEADLNAIVPGLVREPGSGSGESSMAPVQTIHPTYESWDVLRQYPRYTPNPQPIPAASKPQSEPKHSKD